MGDKDKISKMIIHRMQQERKNDQRRMHKNKIERDRLHIQTRYIDWSKSICANDFASSKMIIVKRLEKLYERRQEIEENKKNNNNKKKKMNDHVIEDTKKQQKQRAKQKKDGDAKFDNRNSDGKNEVVEAERRKKEVAAEKHQRITASQLKEARRQVIMNKISQLSGGYRDNDPPPIYYRKKGIQPPEKILNQWMATEQPNIYASLATTNQQTENQQQQQRKTTNSTSTGGAGADPRTQLRSAPASTDRVTSSPMTSFQQDQKTPQQNTNKKQQQAENTKKQQQRPKTAAPTSNRKPPTGSRRPKTAGNHRLFTSSNTHLSEAEQDYVKRRIRRKSACIRRERNQLANSTATAAESNNIPSASRCKSATTTFRSRSSMSRDEGRKLIDYLSSCKQADLEAGVVDVQIQAKKLLISATQEYQKCLQQDVSKFIVDQVNRQDNTST